jgi:MtfA peptidase
VFEWLRKRRRRKTTATPFPSAWESLLQRYTGFLAELSEAEQIRLRNSIKVFMAEKNFEGCAGQAMQDEQRIAISAQMARMTLGMPDEWFDEVRSILLYPDAYVAKSQEMIGSVVVEGQTARAGEAWYRGPVILSWADVLATARQHNHGRNVVIHEFAHQLDMRNGRHADGIPVIENAALAHEWYQTLQQEFHRLTAFCQAGARTSMDCYGATNHAEFFAVASESFFEQPQQFHFEWPDVYRLLARFYGQNRLD